MYHRLPRDLGDDDVRFRFEHDGYLRCGPMLDTSALAAAHARITDLLVDAGLAEPATFPARPRYLDRTDSRLDLSEITLAAISQEDFEAAFHSASVLDRIRGLLGEPEAELFVHPQKVIRIVPPRHSALYASAGVHQDFPELQGSSRQITMWCPLVDVEPDSAALPVYPGSHRGGILPLELQDSPSGWGIPAERLSQPDVGSLSPGEALMFSTFTAHGGSTNDTDSWRLSVECRYQPLADPISQPALALPGCGFGWDEVYRGWTRLGHYWLQRKPPIQPWDDSWERWRDIESLKLGHQGDQAARRALLIASSWGRSEAVRSTAAELLRRLIEFADAT